jgi:hypothetical protein
MNDLTPQELALAESLGTAAGADIRKSIPLIRSRVKTIQRLDGMKGIEPGTGKIMANTYIDVVIRAIEELRP